jgi:hypothetical protein
VGTVAAPILIGIGLGAGMDAQTVMSLFAVPAAVAAAALIVISAANRDTKSARAETEAERS